MHQNMVANRRKTTRRRRFKVQRVWWGKRERAACYTLFLHKSIAISVNPSVYAIPFPKHTVCSGGRESVHPDSELNFTWTQKQGSREQSSRGSRAGEAAGKRQQSSRAAEA